MLDGPDYIDQPIPDYRFEALQALNTCVIEENRRLKALLDQHNIPYVVRDNSLKTHRMSLRHAKVLPLLPKELQLKILGYALTCPHPIIDPFIKHRVEHLTQEERKTRKKIPVNLFVVCRDFQSEGLRLFIANNDFIFTQLAALHRFAQVPAQLRSGINHVTLRIVGRYYDNEQRKQNFLGLSYHPELRDFKTPITRRPEGANMDRGLHAYCYYQFGDFLKALLVPKPTGPRSIEKLLPSLKSIRIDLVNFCDYLWHPGRDFAAIIRWQTGPIVEEMIITGVPEDDPEEGVESLLDRLVIKEGVFSSGPPIFASAVKHLKPLRPLGLATRVVRAETNSEKLKKGLEYTHPEGGKAPPSFYPPGRTIWKYTQDRLDKPQKRWIEFDRRTGYPAEDVDMWSDIGDDEMYDSDGEPIDQSDDTDSDVMAGIEV